MRDEQETERKIIEGEGRANKHLPESAVGSTVVKQLAVVIVATAAPRIGFDGFKNR
jgi:hypothetical protein